MRTRESVEQAERAAETCRSRLDMALSTVRVRMEDYLQERGWKRQQIQYGSRWHSHMIYWSPPKAVAQALYTLRAAWAAQAQREKGAAQRAKRKATQ